MHGASLAAVALVPVLGCGGGVATAQDAGAAAPPDGSAQVDAPYGIACTFFQRDVARSPVPQHTETRVELATDAPTDKTTNIAPGVDARTTLAATSPDTIALEVAVSGSSTATRFDLPTRTKPAFAFPGFHGFSGLVYVALPSSTLDIQWTCRTLPEPARELSPGPRPPAPSLPLALTCTMTTGDDGGTASQSVVITSAVDRTISGSAGRVDLHVMDDPFEGRSLLLQLSPFLARPGAPGGWRQQTLFQLDPSVPVVDPGLGPAR